jgi:hypothetical protein
MTIPTLAPIREQILDARLAQETALRNQAFLVHRRLDLKRFLANAQPDEAAALAAQLAQVESELPAADAQVAATTASLDAAKQAYDDAVVTEPEVWSQGGGLPVLMLPVRIETVYRTGPDGQELWIRVYPDDIHVDSHEPELTAREIAVAQDYWRRVWAAGAGDGDSAVRRRDQAWRDLVSETSRSRASWVAQQVQPMAEPPVVETPPEVEGPDPVPFREPPTKDAAWTRAPHTTLLPERFAFTAYRGGRVLWRVEGGPIPDVLPVSFAPPGSDPVEPEDGLPFDDDSRWLIDFGKAVDVGMGIKVPITDADPSIDVLTAVGVLANIDPATGVERVERMLVSHRYTDGLGILPTGTPTNNTPKTRSLWRSKTDPSTPQEHERRRALYDPASGQPAARLARALGIDGQAELTTLADGEFDDDDGVRAVQDLVSRILLWSRQWLARDETVQFLASGLEFIGNHSRDFVRNRGPLPVLRIGRQPYGILPTTSMDLWRGDDVDVRIVRVIQSFLLFAHEHVDLVAQLGRGANEDLAYLDVMSRLPAADKVWQLDAGGGLAQQPPGLIGAIPGTSLIGDRPYPVRPDRPHLISDPEPPELQAIAAQKPMTKMLEAIVAIKAFYESWDWNRGDPNGQPPGWEAALAEANAMQPLATSEAAGVVYPFLSPVVSLTLFCAPFIAITAFKPNADADQVARAKAALDELIAMSRDAVSVENDAAENLGRLERLFCESLDTTTHRLDAWVTSLSSARLAAARTNGAAGLRVGAYGWLTEVRPVDPADRAVRDGYIVSPSLHHATTAAVLRSGYLAHGGEERESLAVNLTSRRVRRATALLDGVRSGQTLSALLGYQFERALHDASLDVYVSDFRSQYPLAPQVDPGADGAAESQQAIAARSVTDGNALRLDRAEYEAGGGGVTIADADHRGKIVPMIAELDDAVDALGDLLLAEGVHHLVGGNALRAGATVDAMAGGDWLPNELDVIATPRSGSLLTYSVGDLTPPADAVQPGWNTTRPIAALSPELELLCHTWLGAASGWSFAVRTSGGQVVATLADLDVSATEVMIDAVDHADPDHAGGVVGAGPGTASPILRALLRAAGPDALGLLEGEQGLDRFAELTALASQWRVRLADSTPLLLSHIAPSLGSGWELANVDDVAARLTTWLGGITAGRDALSAARTAVKDAADDAARDAAITKVVSALDALAKHGVRGSRCAGQPVDDGGREALLTQADAVLDQLASSVPETVAPAPLGRTATSVQSWFADSTAIVRTVVGDMTQLLPVIDLGDTAAALAADHRPNGADDARIADWLTEVGRVRPATDDLSTARQASEVLAAAPAPTFVVTQTPGDSSEPWIAHSAAGDGGLKSPRMTCVLRGTPPITSKVSGLVFDQWTEALPGRPRPDQPPEEIAGIAFHFDRPDARAPQAALLAVPPDPGRTWRAEDLHTIVIETLDLAMIRSLDLTDVPQLRAVLPLQYMDLG